MRRITSNRPMPADPLAARLNPHGRWMRRRGCHVWVANKGPQCCHNKKNQHFCPFGPNCDYCLETVEHDGELSPTLYPGSPWASSPSSIWEDDGPGDWDQC